MIRALLQKPVLLLLTGLLITAAVYWPGLYGGYIYDDFPNIVDNTALHLQDWRPSSLAGAALSSPSSEFKRPLSSLSFAFNHLLGGLDPFRMKLTNLLIHLANALLVYGLTRRILRLLSAPGRASPQADGAATRIAALVAIGWALLPINLTAVLYVVQRMESLANLFVLTGLIGYVMGRQTMQAERRVLGMTVCVASLMLGATFGLAAKETAVLLPLYALLVESVVFRFRRGNPGPERGCAGRRDPWIITLFTIMLALPLALGLAWLLPDVLRASTWTRRDFTLGERLLTEGRVVVDYLVWTVLPTPGALSFYHDDYIVSRSLWSPPSTLPCIALLAGLLTLAITLHRRLPVFSLGVGLFLGAQTLTATVLPLELVFEHRNYFASYGLMLALIPLLLGRRPAAEAGHGAQDPSFPLARTAAFAALLVLWTTITALTAHSWRHPLTLALELSARAPDSQRAIYELGKAYIVASRYDAESPYTALAMETLESASARNQGSILPEHALIYTAARMQQPQKDQWWERMQAKLAATPPSVEDDGAVMALARCARDRKCELPPQRMVDVFLTALAHGRASPRLLAAYGDYAWNVLDDRDLAEAATRDAVKADPAEPEYRITLIRMLLARGNRSEASEQLAALTASPRGRYRERDIAELRALLADPQP